MEPQRRLLSLVARSDWLGLPNFKDETTPADPAFWPGGQSPVYGLPHWPSRLLDGRFSVLRGGGKSCEEIESKMRGNRSMPRGIALQLPYLVVLRTSELSCCQKYKVPESQTGAAGGPILNFSPGFDFLVTNGPGGGSSMYNVPELCTEHSTNDTCPLPRSRLTVLIMGWTAILRMPTT